MRLLSFAGVNLPCGDEQNDTPIALRNNLIELRDGAYDQDGNDTAGLPVQVGRSITVTMACPADDETAKDNLIHALSSGRRILRAVLNDGVTYRQTFAKVTNISRPYSTGTGGADQLQVTFQMDYPYWIATEDEPKYFDNDLIFGGFYFDGHHDDQALAATSQVMTITNSGQERVPRGKIILIPAGGVWIFKPRFTNAANLMWLQYDDMVAFPHRLEIDFLTKTVKYDAVAVYNKIVIPSGQMDWMILERGTNVITITCNAVSGSTVMEWYWGKHYR